jgi:hypothetical protein
LPRDSKETPEPLVERRIVLLYSTSNGLPTNFDGFLC